MQALLKLKTYWLRFRNPKKPYKFNTVEQLPDVVKEELSLLALYLKTQHVSVRDLYEGETASETPEIGDEPITSQNKDQ